MIGLFTGEYSFCMYDFMYTFYAKHLLEKQLFCLEDANWKTNYLELNYHIILKGGKIPFYFSKNYVQSKINTN